MKAKFSSYKGEGQSEKYDLRTKLQMTEQKRVYCKGKTNWAQSVLVRLLWLLYLPCSTHRPHMYPTPGWVWGMGVVGGCARAVPAWPPSPLTPFLHNLAVVPARQIVLNLSSLYLFSILSSIILWTKVIIIKVDISCLLFLGSLRLFCLDFVLMHTSFPPTYFFHRN